MRRKQWIGILTVVMLGLTASLAWAELTAAELDQGMCQLHDLLELRL